MGKGKKQNRKEFNRTNSSIPTFQNKKEPFTKNDFLKQLRKKKTVSSENIFKVFSDKSKTL